MISIKKQRFTHQQVSPEKIVRSSGASPEEKQKNQNKTAKVMGLPMLGDVGPLVSLS